MLSEEKYEELYHKARLWMNSNKDFDFIHNKLIENGADALSATEIVKEVKLIVRAQKRQQGSIIMLSGSVILIAGLLLLLSGFFMQTSFTYLIIGFTSVGFAVICYGLFKMIS